MAARTGARTGLSPPALASDSSALDHPATEGTYVGLASLCLSLPCGVVDGSAKKRYVSRR